VSDEDAEISDNEIVMGDEETSGEDDGWQYVSIEHLENAGFRFQVLEGGQVDVEVLFEEEGDEAPASWYARGYLECYLEMMDTIRALMSGNAETAD
jgi:hypothetical protein